MAARTTALGTADAAKWVNRQLYCSTQLRATISMSMLKGTGDTEAKLPSGAWALCQPWTRRISSSREIGGAKRDLVIAQTRPAVCARIAVIIVIWICSVQGTVRALLLNEIGRASCRERV